MRRACVEFRVKLSRTTGVNLPAADCERILRIRLKIADCGLEATLQGDPGRGLHSLTCQLNLSAFHGIGGARRGCVTHVKGVLRVV